MWLKILNTKHILKGLIFLTYLYIIIFTFLHNRKNDGYVLGDWLINYQDGGFKRRGLSGSFFFFLQDITSIKLNLLVLIFQIIIITLFFIFYLKLINNIQISLLYLSLLTSPLGFIAYFNCVDYVGKKEFLMFSLFSFFVLQVFTNTYSKYKEYLVLVLLFIFTLFHEITVFYVPYFVIILYLKNKKIELKRFIMYFVAVAVPALMIVLWGKNINEGNSIGILKERGVVITNGILFWDVDERKYILSQYKDYLLYVISFLISFFHVRFYLKNEIKDYRTVGFLFIASFLFTFPLFFLAIDWGRWMYIHMIMIIIVVSFLLNDEREYKIEKKVILSSKNSFIALSIILFSLIYRVEMSGKGFTFEGFLYRTLIVPEKLLNKMIKI